MKTAAMIAIAASTTAAGGSMLSNESPISISLFLGGIGVAVTCTVYLGQKINELKNLGTQMRAQDRRTDKLEKRMDRMERHVLREQGAALAKTQKIELDDEDLD